MSKKAPKFKLQHGLPMLGGVNLRGAKEQKSRLAPHKTAYFLRYRKGADFRVTQIFMRNRLRAKRLEMKVWKNGPPASASARVFPGELFIASRQWSVVSGQLNSGTTSGAEFGVGDSFGFRPHCQAGCVPLQNERENWRSMVAPYRLLPPFIAFYRLLSLPTKKVFLPGRDSSDGKGGELSPGLGQSDGFFRLPSASVAFRRFAPQSF